MIPPRSLLFSALLALSAAAPASAAVTLTPGSVLVASFFSDSIDKYSYTGERLESVSTNGVFVRGIAVINNEVYVNNNGQVGKFNLTTGVTTPIAGFTVTGLALGTSGDNLISFNQGTSSVEEFTTSGVLVKTVGLGNVLGAPGFNDIGGLDTYGGEFSLAKAIGDDRIFNFDATGALTTTVDVNSVISSLTVDSSDGSFWLTIDGAIRHLDRDGNFLGGFVARAGDGTPRPPFGGVIEVIPVPEPSAPALVLLLAGSTVFRRRRA